MRCDRSPTSARTSGSGGVDLAHGQTAVVVGVGVSGIAIAELLKAFGMRVVGVTRTPRPSGLRRNGADGRLAEAAREADYLINVLPGAEEEPRHCSTARSSMR